MKLYQSSKNGLPSLFFCKLPTSSNSPSTATSNASSAAADLHSNQMMINEMVTSQVLVTIAECRMILRIIKNHDSFRSCLGLGDDLKAMFPDHAIAAGFTLSKTKCAYYVVISNTGNYVVNTCCQKFDLHMQFIVLLNAFAEVWVCAHATACLS